MKTLGFERRCRIAGGRRIRSAIFESRSMLPVSAACLVANAARQKLSELLGTAVTLKLIEPVLPDPAGWTCICEGAQIFAVRGENSDAAFVLRCDDALAIAGAAFGERIEGGRALSAIEAELLARVAAALCGTLAPVCGVHESSRVTRVNGLEGFLSYFEIVLEAPVEARVGVALSREPQPHVVPSLDSRDLDAIELRLSVEVAHGFLPAASILNLRRGEIIKLDSSLGDPALLRAETAVIARGECGELNGRPVIAVR